MKKSRENKDEIDSIKKRMWREVIDSMVQKLNDNGVENTPHNDKDWW